MNFINSVLRIFKYVIFTSFAITIPAELIKYFVPAPYKNWLLNLLVPVVIGGALLSFFSVGARRHRPANGEDFADYVAQKPRYTFADVDGMGDLKAELTQNIKRIAKDGKNGILFFGAPGNGKTFIAEALAGELPTILGTFRKAAFMKVTMGDLTSRWIGQTTEQLQRMFAQAESQARRHGGLVLFLDEIDSVVKDRRNLTNSSNPEATDIVTSMLTLINDYGAFAKHKIVIVAATNYIEHLDPAAIREGRFDFKVEIPVPDRPARLGILHSVARNKGVTLPPEVADRVATRWEGFGVARLRLIADNAATFAREDSRSVITFEDMMRALRKAQGVRSADLAEDALTLDQLAFDDQLAGRLKALARRMTEIDRIEAMGGTVPKGVLFYGPPGTGKTAVAKALTRASGWTIIPTTGQKIMADAGEFERIVDRASDLRPSIIFIDEADDILADRATNPYGKSATNNLLAILDGNRPLRDVMFIAATNFADSMDIAALRGGRFAEHFYFDLPSDDTLVSIVKDYLATKTTAPFAPEFTAEAIVGILRGHDPQISPANARDRIQQAINQAVSRLDGSQISLDDLHAVLG